MKHRNGISRWTWIALVVGAGLCLAAAAARRQLIPLLGTGDPELTALLTEREHLQDNTDERLARLKAQYASQPHEPWNAQRLRKLTQPFSSEWVVTPATGGSSPDVTLTLLRHDLRAWRYLSQAIQTLESTAGAAFESIDVRADGIGNERRLSQVTIAVRLH